MKYNYHTHTFRCGHANGSDEEYVLEAIKNKMQVLGFSDHIHFDDLKSNYNYIQDIFQLKEKYQKQIQILIGLEVEYFPPYLPFYQKLLAEKKVDYLIFGNHAYLPKGKSKKEEAISFIDEPFSDPHFLDLYYENLENALKSGLFRYICHPDCFLKGYRKWDEHSINLAHKIGRLCEKYDVYLELSGSGFRSKKRISYQNKLFCPYPFEPFFAILKQYQLKFVLGADAHAPEQLHDAAIDYIENMAKKLDLPIVEKIF